MVIEGIRGQLLAMTWYNPLFAIVVIGALWFIPGIILRRIIEKAQMEKKKKNQSEAIKKLYPKELQK